VNRRRSARVIAGRNTSGLDVSPWGLHTPLVGSGIMHEQQSEGISPGLPDQPTGPSSESLFSLRKRFPGQALPAEPAPPSPPARTRKTFWRLLVPLCLFIAMVGGIAFVVQYTPNWRSKRTAKLPPPRPTQTEVIEFPQRVSVWDPDDKTYIKEFEQEKRGYFDYPFQNHTGKAAELGIFQPNCDCAGVEVFLLSSQELAAWKKAKKQGKTLELNNAITLKVDERNGIEIPADSGGLMRIAWKSRKAVGEELRVNVRVWAQPKGKMAERTFVELETSSRLVAPVLFDQVELSLGAIAPGAVAEAQCTWWSATRSKVELKAASDDPLVTWTVTPYSSSECAELEKQLRKLKINSRVQAAGRLSVKVQEQKGRQQLDQGPLNRPAPLLLDDQPLAIVPRLLGRVQGEVEVGIEKDHGKINLHNFSSAKGKKLSMVLRSEPGTELALDSVKPSYLKVQIRANKAASTTQKKSWILEVEVPAGSHLGPFAEDSAVILKTQSTPPRYIRIPVLGSATPG
jgi:hypothetical protein